MVRAIDKLFSLAEKLETKAVNYKEQSSSYWSPKYFESKEDALSFIEILGKNGKGYRPEETIGGWLITKDDEKFYDSTGNYFSKEDLDLIHSNKSPEELSGLRQRLRAWRKSQQFGGLEEAYANDSYNDLISTAKKDSKKLDPKAEVRNRGTVCVPAERAKDKKDHFPINNIDQARNALARAHQYDKVPPWYKGSLKGLQDLVSKKVHSKYPSIGKEKKSTEYFDAFLKYAEDKYDQPKKILDPAHLIASRIRKINMEINNLQFEARINPSMLQKGRIEYLHTEKEKLVDQLFKLRGQKRLEIEQMPEQFEQDAPKAGKDFSLYEEGIDCDD